MIETRTVAVDASKTQVRLQDEWYDYELIEELLDTDGYFTFVVSHTFDGDRQLESLAKRGLANRNSRGAWYATDTLKTLIEGQGGMP